MKRQVFLWVALMLLPCSLIAQNGTISGTVIDKTDGKNEPVAFANVLVVELQTGGATDFDGNYNFPVPAGSYTVVISSVGLFPDTALVTVGPGETKRHSVSLGQNAQVIKEFNVTGRKVKTAENIQLMERQQAEGIQQTVGAAELQKQAASTVNDGLKKQAGISIVGSRHVVVRGLGDRYNLAYLNGMPIASPDPDKRVIPLDIFPTSVVSSLSINKAFVPSLYGDFSGAAININTRDYPEEPTLVLSAGVGFNSTSTFKDFNSYEGGGNDYLGIDDGTRDIPRSIEIQPEYNSQNQTTNGDGGFDFAKNLNPKTVTAPLANSFSIRGGNFISTDSIIEGSGIGFMVLASHKTSNSIREGAYRIYNRQDNNQLDYNVSNHVANTNTSALGNLAIQITESQKLTYKFLFANQSSDQTRETDGTHFDYQRRIFSRRFTYRENRLVAQQIGGYHGFLDNDRINLKWNYSLNTATSKEPDRRQLVWLFNPGDNPENYILNSIDVNDNHRFFSELEETENSMMAEVNFKLKYDESDENQRTTLGITAGFNSKSKERDFDFRQFNYDFDQFNLDYPDGLDINDPDGGINDANHALGYFGVEELFNAASANNASLDIMAFYAMLDWYVTPTFQVLAGGRFEDGLQEITFRNQTTPLFRERERLDNVDILPSLGLKYQLSEKDFLRANFSQTISRPGFKEVAPFQYIEFFAGLQTVGNPELINGSNTNVDVRYETYPDRGELIAVTGFYKQLEDPIERVMLGTASGQLSSYANSESAILTGAELEVKKKLSNFSFIGDSAGILSDMTLSFNASYLYSQVTIDDSVTVNGASAIQTNNKRALQGASPWLINADLSWQKWLSDNNKLTLTLSYNVFARRIAAVGAQGINDIYDEPVNLLNFVTEYKTGDHWRFRFSVRNILNPEIKQTLDSHLDDATVDRFEVNSYRTGIRPSFSVAYSVF